MHDGFLSTISFSFLLFIFTITWIQNIDCSGELESTKRTKSVIVIGGGVSGLAAATKLIKDGGGEFSVTILEADHHIGGRVKSRKIGDDYVEFGAEWVHGQKGNRVFELMNPLGVLNSEGRDVKEMRESMIYATQRGEIFPPSVNERWNEIKNAIDEGVDWDRTGTQPDSSKPESLGEYSTRIFRKMNSERPIDPRREVQTAGLDYMQRSSNSYESALTWFETSHSREGEQFVDCEGNAGTKWKPPATYSTFLGFIMGQGQHNHGKLIRQSSDIQLPEWIKLNKEVTVVKYDTGNDSGVVSVGCKDGSMYTADHVLTTVSLGVLKGTHTSLFEPDLPLLKQKAITAIGFGTVNKILLEFDRAWWFDVDPKFWSVGFWWDDNTQYDTTFLANLSHVELTREVDGFPLWSRAILGFNIIDSGSHPKVLQGWISGIPARFMETLDKNTVSVTSTRLLRKFLGDRFKNIPPPIRSETSTWYSNPYTRGSYSHRTVKSEEEDVWARDLAQPILTQQGRPLITFAGEATESSYFSTVHGAYDSGIREAERLSKFYSEENEVNGEGLVKGQGIQSFILISTLLLLALV